MYSHAHHKNLKAFSLVELSVVIAIISLIAASVSAGNSLVKSAKIISQISQLQSYQVAFDAFSLKYRAVAGDMQNASSYWSGATNGNGNGYIDSNADSGGTANIPFEAYTLFQHLSKAKLISGNYNNTYVLGVGYPRLAINPSYGMAAASVITGGFPLYPQTIGISDAEASLKVIAKLELMISHPEVSHGGYNDWQGVMSPKQAQTIDLKIDDGLPRAGKVQAYRAWSNPAGTGCIQGSPSTTYRLSDNTISCMMEYVLK